MCKLAWSCSVALVYLRSNIEYRTSNIKPNWGTFESKMCDSLTCAKRGVRRRQNRRNIPCKCFFLSLLHKQNGDSKKTTQIFTELIELQTSFSPILTTILTATKMVPRHTACECRLVKNIDSFTSRRRLPGTSMGRTSRNDRWIAAIQRFQVSTTSPTSAGRPCDVVKWTSTFDDSGWSNRSHRHRNFGGIVMDCNCQVQVHEFVRFWATYVRAFLRNWADAYAWAVGWPMSF